MQNHKFTHKDFIISVQAENYSSAFKKAVAERAVELNKIKPIISSREEGREYLLDVAFYSMLDAVHSIDPSTLQSTMLSVL